MEVGRRDPLDPRLRLRAGARLAPQHARLDDQQEALLGAGAADLRLRGVRHVRRRRRPRGAAPSAPSRAGTQFEGHTPAPARTWTRSRSRCSGCGAPGRAHRRRRATPGWTPGIVPFSTMHYRERPGLLEAVVPGRLRDRELPGPVPQLVLLAAGDEHRAAPRGALQDALRLRHWSSARTAARCTRAGATPSSSTRRPSGWASTSCAGCSPTPGRRTTSSSAGTPPTRRAGELLVLWNVYSFFVTYARLAGWEPSATPRRAVAEARRRSIAGSCRESPGSPPRSRSDLREYDALDAARAIDGFIEELSTWYLRRSRKRFSRGGRRRPTAPRPSPRCTRRWSRWLAILAPILPFLAESMYQNLVVAGGVPTSPDSVHLTSWPTAELARLRDAALEASMAVVHARRGPGRGRCAARPGSRFASRWPGCGSRCRAASWSSATRSWRWPPTRSTSSRSS